MEIKTKFNVGDMIWYLYYWKYEWRPSQAMIFEIKISSFGIQYNSAFEKDCFATKEKAEEECDRRNKQESMEVKK